MLGARNKNAWILVAIAAITFASLARAEAGLQNAKAYAHPVLEFLAKSQGQHALVKTSTRFAQASSGDRFASLFRDAETGRWMAVLPVLFVGLVSPLSLLPDVLLGNAPAIPSGPSLPAKFQRPPPALA